VKFKLDENLGSRTAALIGESGHDVQTVSQEKLTGTDDRNLFEICAAEGRCLITLDLGQAGDVPQMASDSVPHFLAMEVAWPTAFAEGSP